MDVNSAFNSALQALHRADAGLKRNADTIAKHSGHIEGAEDINTALIESQQYKLQAEVAVEVVQAVDETLGRLIDTKA